jgi:hypothetical protein
MGSMRKSHLTSALLAFAMVVSTAAVAAVAGGSGVASAAGSAKFGTLASPCGPGKATGATDQGVTNSTISIAYGDDRGYSGDPGLDQEMGNAVKGFIAW